jgi:hypothetical protein
VGLRDQDRRLPGASPPPQPASDNLLPRRLRLTEQFAPLAKAASKLKVRDAIIDGEATVLGNTGLPDFQALRRELGNRNSSRLLFHAFDLLYLNGRDLRRVPLLQRKHALKSVLRHAPSALVYVDFLGADGRSVFEHACRKGLRDDLGAPMKAPSIVPSAHHPGGRPHFGVPRENILQLLPDAVVPTKEELAAYWAKVHERALAHLGRRPLKLVRHVHGTTFYHKGPLPKDIPDSVHQLHIRKREGGEGTRLWVDSLDGFLGLVTLGAVELHPWNATVDNFECADRLVIDLDPGEGVP